LKVSVHPRIRRQTASRAADQSCQSGVAIGAAGQGFFQPCVDLRRRVARPRRSDDNQVCGGCYFDRLAREALVGQLVELAPTALEIDGMIQLVEQMRAKAAWLGSARLRCQRQTTIANGWVDCASSFCRRGVGRAFMILI